MTPNVGPNEWKVRLLVGALFIAVPLFIEFRDWWGAVPFAIGLVLVATALLRYCPVNSALGRGVRS